MKKNRLYKGLGFVITGSVFLIIFIIMRDYERASMFAGFAGAFIMPGIMEIYKYFYWSKPENKAAYEERLKNEKIALHDERKVMIRGKSAYIMYTVTIIVLALLAFVLSLVGVDKWVLLLIATLLVFEITGGYLVYRHYDKKL